MTRTRWLQGVLAGLCTFAATLPLVTLFTPSAWIRPSAVVVAVVVLVGIATRRFTTSRTAPILAQALALATTINVFLLRETTAYGLPTWATVRETSVLLSQALRTVRDYSAPAPATPGAVFAITLLIGVTAIVVDAIAVTRRAPAAAGVPLLAAYLASATNSGTGLALIWFLVPAVLWLALVGEDGLRRLRQWGGIAWSAQGSGDPVGRFAHRGRIMGGGALVLAALAPIVIPQLPPTFIADGLGRADVGRGSGVTLESTLDVARSLSSRSDGPVLQYTTTAPIPAPLRVDVLTTYADGQWAPGARAFQETGGLLPAPGAALAGSDAYRITVEDNGVRSPQLALPANMVLLTLGADQWQVDENGILRTADQFDTYSADYLDPTLTDNAFETIPNVGPGSGFFDVPEEAALAVQDLTAQIVPEGSTGIEAARAIQSELRGPGWTYSLELAPNDGTQDPITHFLQTRQGYCVQYATAMVMLARASGIPARVAVGYLPGERNLDTWTVRATDAHAWPELWFPQVGWMRFEPTPSVRSGVAPDWTLEQSSSQPTPGATASAPAPSAAAPSEGPDLPTDVADNPAGDTAVSAWLTWLRTYRWWVVAALLALASVLVVPGGSRIRLARARARALDDAQRTEVEWQELMSRLDDLGLGAPDGATPRAAAADVVERSSLTGAEAEAVTRVVLTLERARYARPAEPLMSVRAETNEIARAAARTRSRGRRLRAALWPRAGRRFLTECRDATGRALRRGAGGSGSRDGE
ncbi:MAG: transglutaminase domain-containing protein [Phycicoccus sp.]|nr:transglutaminase domain-containing protein [Phycicoccus sp.]